MRAAKKRDAREYALVLADAFQDLGHKAEVSVLGGEIVVDVGLLGSVAVESSGQLSIDPWSEQPEALRAAIKTIGLGGTLSNMVVTNLHVVRRHDDDPDVSWLQDDYRGKPQEDRDADAARLAAFRAGDWHMIFLEIEAIVQSGPWERLVRSMGIGGVESDSPDYHKELAKQEYDELAERLRSMGVRRVLPLKDARWV